MSQVISFQGYTPPARFDSNPWTEARVEEGLTETGSWSLIDTLVLDPVDADPTQPQIRNLTTENASDTTGLWYRIIFADALGGTSLPTEPIQNLLPSPTSRDLCTLADVLRYIPGYDSNDPTDATFAALITSESEAIHDETGREIIAFGDQPASRAFTVTHDHALLRKVAIGDLASAGDTDIAVELLASDDTVVETIAREKYRPLYETKRQPLNPWEPVTDLLFPIGLGNRRFTAGQTLLVTGNWGFPAVPSFIVEACAKRVILRYASDVAAAGTQAAAAIADINLAGLFASARDDVYRLKHGVMIA
jgi:hypothetical protein